MQVASASIGPTINQVRSSVGHDAALNVTTTPYYAVPLPEVPRGSAPGLASISAN
jgi:hypothetical protein